MRWLRKLFGSLLMLSAMILTIGQTAYAADEEEYTYTVRLYAGNQGELTGEGIRAPEGASVTANKDQVVISGLKYGDTVYMVPQDAAEVSDSRYYVRGVRRSGRDNSEATESSFAVGSDRDYVIAYGIKGDMVAYTVNYMDASGNVLLESDTYYGNLGERQYVSARYVDGYQPQAYNLVMTLAANEAENVFNFVYTPVQTGTTPAPENLAGTPGTSADNLQTPAEVPENPAGTEAPAGAEDPAGAGQEELPDADVPVGGDQTQIPDADTPLGLDDLDDPEVPLASGDMERPGTVMSYFPMYAGIGAAATVLLIVVAVYLGFRKRCKAVISRSSTEDVKRSMDFHDDEK